MNRQEEIIKKITDSMQNIFAFSLTRTHNAADAEDLSQQIIAELLSSCNQLKDVGAFYGWMWSVGRNTYSKYLRERDKEKNYLAPNENESDIYFNAADIRGRIEDNLIMQEDKNLLRRELSLLTQKYRDAVVKYYLEDKSCSQIAFELSVTVETVKHLLFKARKILKEGINMTREYGEKSYNPGVFRFDKWLDGFTADIRKIDALFEDRRLSGNILLSAYYTPLTMDEISMELGVAVPYLEDEIKILLKYGLLKQFQNGRYQTNIFIYTAACQEDIILKTKELFKKYEQKLSVFVDGKTQEVKELIFKDTGVTQNKLRWFVSHFILWHTFCNHEKIKTPPFSFGGSGYLWGYNHEYHKYGHGFRGIYGKSSSERFKGWIHASNYVLLEKSQEIIGNNGKDNDFMLAAANKQFGGFTPDEIAEYLRRGFIEKDGDAYSSLCNVMTQAQYDKLCGICSDAINEMSTILTETIDVTADVMQNHAPTAVQEQCKSLASINSPFATMSHVMRNLCDSGYLSVPYSHEFLTVYTVI